MEQKISDERTEPYKNKSETHYRGAGYNVLITFEPPIDNFHKTHLKGENRGVQVKKSQIDIT